MTSQINGLESRLNFSHCDKEVTVSICSYQPLIYNGLNDVLLSVVYF